MTNPLRGVLPAGLTGRSGGLPFTMPALALLALAFLLPLALLLPTSVTGDGFGFDAYERLFADDVYWGIVKSTARIALLTTLITVLVGYPLALWISRLSPRWKIIALIAVVLPFWVSILVRTYSWTVVLGREGLINDVLLRLRLVDQPVAFLYEERGVLIGTVNILAPFFILPMYASMNAIDNRLVQAAESLGASARQAFWRVYFPMTAPALVSGGFLVFVLTFGFYVTPAILGGGRVQMLATLMEYIVNVYPDWPLAAALSVVLLVGPALLYGVSKVAGRLLIRLETRP